MQEDDPVLDSCLGGDRTAFDTLVERHRDQILRYLFSVLRSEAHAEDLTQETFRKAWENLDSFERRGKFSSWLYRIAVNLARNHLRRVGHQAKLQSPDQLDQAPHPRRKTPLSSLVRRETEAFLLLALDQLPPSMREVFVLHTIEGLDYDEISTITDISARTLSVRALRARRLLRERLGNVVDTFWIRKESGGA